jgi:hypothetical protein
MLISPYKVVLLCSNMLIYGCCGVHSVLRKLIVFYKNKVV